MKLSSETLAQLDRPGPTASGLAVPGYDRSQIRTGIMHFGVGGFHRAHQAMYLDRLMNQGQAYDFGICGVGVLPHDRHMAEVMTEQDCLYTLVLKHADGRKEARIIGSMIDYLYAPEDPERVLEQLAAPEVRIVSLTITEGGYNIDRISGEFQAEDPAVQRDAQAGPGQAPGTVFGLIIEGLRRRRERGHPPFTIMSCDNIQGNGTIARKVFTSFARLREETLVAQGEPAGLSAWVQEHVPFPNSMVDRITPVTSDADRAALSEEFGIEDGWPVVCEPFTQWVLEDDFAAGRPALDQVGVQLVSDVEPYELMKLRLLNASHQALCYFGYLAGYRFAHEAAQDADLAQLLLDYMHLEAEPTLAPVPGIDLAQYQRTLIERFSNEYVRDTLARLCAESSDRIPTWLLPVVRANLVAQRDVHRSAAVVASWARYAEGVDEQGQPIKVVDRLKGQLMAAAARQHENPLAFLEQAEVFGNLAAEPRFTEAYLSALNSLHEQGSKVTVQGLVR